MRLRAGMGLLCVGVGWGALAGCQHVPEGVKIDLDNRVVEVGPCRCRLPATGEAKPPEAPPAGGAPAKPADEPAATDEPR